MRWFSNAARWSVLVFALPVLGACSEYLARRDLISVYGGDAVAGNTVVQMIDPWPRAAADRNIAYDGAVMERAVHRYHTGRVIPPQLGGTSSVYGDAGQSAQPGDPPPSAAAQATASK